MRDLKFRAWDEREKKWKGMWIFRGGHSSEKEHYEEPEVFDLSKYVANPKYENTKHIVIEQCVVGDLFEGDIVRDSKNKKDGWCAVIEWHETGFVLSTPHPGDRDLSELISRGRLEVIGNIHENSDLLN
jgi:hypothetical protein